MKYKNFFWLTTSSLLVVTIPIATTISCSNSKSVDNNINDHINDLATNIKINNNQAFNFQGNDGEGTFKLNPTPSQKILLDKANVKYEYYIKYYKDGNSATFSKVDPIKVKDLSNFDTVKVKIQSPTSDYLINGKQETEIIVPLEEDALKINWFEPAKNSIDADSMVKIVTIENEKIIQITLPSNHFYKTHTNFKTNQLIFALAKKLGILFSNDSDRYIAMVSDNIPNPINMEDICNSLENASKQKISKIQIKYSRDKSTEPKWEELNLNNMENKLNDYSKKPIIMESLLSDGKELLEKYKLVPLDDKKQATIDINDATAQLFALEYGSVVTPETERLLTLIGALKDDAKALAFIPKLAIGYGNIFQWLILTNAFKDWANENRIRPAERTNVPNTFMATLFRFKPKNL